MEKKRSNPGKQKNVRDGDSKIESEEDDQKHNGFYDLGYQDGYAAGIKELEKS